MAKRNTKLNDQTKGRGITAEMAVSLAEALGTSSRIWMNLQSTFYLVRASAGRNAVAMADEFCVMDAKYVWVGAVRRVCDYEPQKIN